MEITLKNPQPGDIGWLISTHGVQYSEEYSFDQEFEIDIARKAISFLEQNNDFNRIFIAYFKSKRIGSIAISFKPDKTAFINFLLVKKQYRGKGVAKRLIDKAISHAINSDSQLIQLETYSCLKNARFLYKNYGFTIYKTNPRKRKYGQTFDQEFWEKKI